MVKRIKELCEEKSISIAELERQAEISQKKIFGWDEHMPSADRLARVAKILGTTSEELLEARDDKQAVNS